MIQLDAILKNISNSINMVLATSFYISVLIVFEFLPISFFQQPYRSIPPHLRSPGWPSGFNDYKSPEVGTQGITIRLKTGKEQIRDIQNILCINTFK